MSRLTPGSVVTGVSSDFIGREVKLLQVKWLQKCLYLLHGRKSGGCKNIFIFCTAAKISLFTVWPQVRWPQVKWPQQYLYLLYGRMSSGRKSSGRKIIFISCMPATLLVLHSHEAAFPMEPVISVPSLYLLHFKQSPSNAKCLYTAFSNHPTGKEEPSNTTSYLCHN